MQSIAQYEVAKAIQTDRTAPFEGRTALGTRPRRGRWTVRRGRGAVTP
jgi:hypothetical protein